MKAGWWVVILTFGWLALTAPTASAQVELDRCVGSVEAGTLLYRQAQYTEALEQFQQAYDCYKTAGNRTEEAKTLNNIAVILAYMGRFEQALGFLEQALIIDQELANRQSEGITLHNIGRMYNALGQYAQALIYYQRSLAILEEIGNKNGLAQVLNSMGGIYTDSGRYDQALGYLRQSLSIWQEIGKRQGESYTLNNIGLALYNQGEVEQARDTFRQSLVIIQELNDPYAEAQLLNNIGGTYEERGEVQQALDYFKQGLAVRQEIGDRAGEAQTLNNIGLIYDKLGEYNQALETLRQSLILQQALEDQTAVGLTFSNIGLVYGGIGQYDKALEYLQPAMDTLEEVRAESGSDMARAKFIAQYDYLYRNTVYIFHYQDQSDKAFVTSERSRARAFLDSLITDQVQLGDDAAAELLAQEREWYARRQDIRLALGEARTATPPNREAIANLETALAQAGQVYQQIQQKIADYSTQLNQVIPGRSTAYVLDMPQVQTLLDEETTLVSYYLLGNPTLAFIITRDDFQAVTLDVDVVELSTQVQNFRDFANTTTAYPNSVITLYGWLIEPLKPYLNTTNLVFIPHNFLHYLPFAALTDGEHYLIDDYTLSVLPSASALPFIQENAKQTAYSGQPSALIAGNPVTADYDTVASLATTRDSLGSLPFAEKEARAIAELFGVEPLIGEAATETAVRERVSEANILHLAAHGKFNPVAPLNSLIALAPDKTVENSQLAIGNWQFHDGWLTVGESYGLDLKNTDLVVLSACETNLGDLSAGDELVGLTRALIFAGTPSVIASLWAVEDQATSRLMEQFYTHLKDGESKAESLRQAQIEVREEYPNPYYWSGFVLSGDPGLKQESMGAEKQGSTGAGEPNGDNPVAVESRASVDDETTAPVEAGGGQASGSCLSLLLILGAMASVGVVVRRRNG